MNKKEYAKPAIVAKAIDAEPMLAGSNLGANERVPEHEPEGGADNCYAKPNTFTSVWDD